MQCANRVRLWPFVYATALNTAYDPIHSGNHSGNDVHGRAEDVHLRQSGVLTGKLRRYLPRAPVTLRDGLVNSLNVVTVEVAMEVTIGRVMNLAAKAGIPKPPRSYPAMALGTSEATPLQVASAYTAFANLGSRSTPIAVNRITTGDGVTLAAPSTQRNEVLKPEVAYVMTSFMKDVVNRGTAAKVRSRGLAVLANKTEHRAMDGLLVTPRIWCVPFGLDLTMDLSGITGPIPHCRSGATSGVALNTRVGR